MIYAVITGDVVNSSKVKKADKNIYLDSLKDTFQDIKEYSQNKNKVTETDFDIFRGDSFQGVISEPATALRAAIFIRSGMRKNQPSNAKNHWDTRIAIGLGDVDHLPENVSEGDGPAFRNSGPVLDSLKGNYRCAISTPWDEANNEFKVSCALLDAIIARWTIPQAEIIWQLLQHQKAKTIAEKLDISPVAVHYRVKGAGWFAIEELLKRYNTIIKTKID